MSAAVAGLGGMPKQKAKDGQASHMPTTTCQPPHSELCALAKLADMGSPPQVQCTAHHPQASRPASLRFQCAPVEATGVVWRSTATDTAKEG